LLLLLWPLASAIAEPHQGARLAHVGPGQGVERSSMLDGENLRG